MEISTSTDGAIIYYTVDGSDPDQTSSIYTEPITVDETMTLKAYAVKAGYVDSATVSADYIIQVATPTFSHESGVYSEAFNLSLSCSTADANIYYSTDGSDPRVGGALYSSPLSITSSEEITIRAYAVRESMPDSEIASASYSIGGTSGLTIQEQPHYSVEIVPPDDWTGEPVITNALETFAVKIAPENTVIPSFSWYIDGKYISTSQNLTIGNVGNVPYIRTPKGPHTISVETSINGKNYHVSYGFRSSDYSPIGNAPIIPLIAEEGKPNELFGSSVAISGDYAVVGAPSNYTSNVEGSIYIFKKNITTGSWDQTSEIKASDGTPRDYYGSSVSISGDYIIVGAYGKNSAYIYKKLADESWVEVSKLEGATEGTSARFGSSVSIYENKALVGAWGDDTNGPISGSAYFYEFNSSTDNWELINKLTGDEGDYFGRSVAMEYQSAIIGSYGSDNNGKDSGYANIYTFNEEGKWVFNNQIVGNEGEFLGKAVSIDDSKAVIGSSKKVLFLRQSLNTSKWEIVNTVSNNEYYSPYFGSSVSIHGDFAIIGTPYRSLYSTEYGFGHASIISKKDSNIWCKTIEYSPYGAPSSSVDNFGESVSIDNTYAVVGHPDDEKAYIYRVR